MKSEIRIFQIQLFQPRTFRRRKSGMDILGGYPLEIGISILQASLYKVHAEFQLSRSISCPIIIHILKLINYRTSTTSLHLIY